VSEPEDRHPDPAADGDTQPIQPVGGYPPPSASGPVSPPEPGEQPDQWSGQQPGEQPAQPSAQPDPWSAEQPAAHDGHFGGQQPNEQPAAYDRPYGQPQQTPEQPAQQPDPWPVQQPNEQPAAYDRPYGQPQQPTAPYPTGPYGYPPAYPRHAAPSSGTARIPGWAWISMIVLALFVGALGGVLGGVAVSTSMRGDVGNIPVIGADNGAAAPLKADNGSITAVAARLLPSTVQIQAKGGADGAAGGGATGSGFVLDDRGHVVTNNHVVADATGEGEIKVVDQNGRKHAAKILGRSPVYDLAVLDVDGSNGMTPAAIGSSRRLRVGDTVVAIGSPLGLSSTVTSGIVSATDRPVTTGNSNQSSYINALQTDAAINPGNSGGPLVNLRGQVVGVNSAIATTGGTIGGESGNIGVGFAIPMEQVRVTASQILATGKARYPVIGANVDTSEQSNGAEVVDVPAGTPAADGGLRKGDVVTEVDGKPITNGIGLIVAIRSHQPGETIDLAVQRDGRRRDVRVKLDSKVG
jgi:putative serine protease PepD